MTNALAAFISDRILEDDIAAMRILGRGPGEWNLASEGNWGAQLVDPYREGLATFLHRADAEHVVRHDPDRVLRQGGATRAILARYEDCLARQEDDDYPARTAIEQAREYEDFVLPNIALSWSDHPDYDQDWKP